MALEVDQHSGRCFVAEMDFTLIEKPGGGENEASILHCHNTQAILVNQTIK